MLRKVLGILVKIILGIFLFLFVIGFIIIPLALTWAIPAQGTKILKTPVHLRSVGFNPFILQLTLNDFEIQDHQNRVMIGFDKFMVRSSFLDLLKKIYHVEDLEIDGLKINVELLPKNQINLLELVPPGNMPSPTKESKQPATNAVKVQSAPSQPLPTVIIDSMELHQGQVHFTDKTITPHFSTTIGAIELNVTNVTTNPTTQAKIDFHANLDSKGKISMHTIIIPLAQPLEMETSFSLNNYALSILTPYTGKYTGRELKNGELDLKLDYRIGGNMLTANHKVLVQQFEFGGNVASKDALHLPFGLAVALLEDPQGRIKITLPASGDMSNPKFQYSHLIVQVISNFFINLVTKPFSFLASTLGGSDTGTDELGYVRFAPGKSDLVGSQKQKLITLIKGLKAHPKLRLEIDGAYDPQADWKAIQAASFAKEYEQLRKVSDWPDSKVYQLLYQRHFGIRALWALAKKYKEGVGNYKDTALDKEIKRQLIENAPPDQGALNVLAQSRAQLIDDFLVTHGFDAQHLVLGHSQPTQASMGYVPLEFTLTVFGKT